MFLRDLLRRPSAVAGAVTIGAALAVSSFGMVRADTHRVHPDKTCNKTSACLYVQNSGTAMEGVTTNANARALYIYATSGGADGTDINGGYIGIIGRAPAGSGLYPLVLTDSNGTDLDYTDTNGNIYYHGSLIGFSKTRDGQKVASYATESTMRNLEDVGSGQLVNGRAVIVLDRTFSRSIDVQSPYHVFLTPGGDTKGLYVAQKTATSFVVRETQGGRGSLSFDYRIVAPALGHASERMGTVHYTEPSAPIRK